ncbi:hypothetical protein IGS73_14795 [Janibacter indicus]|uniref:Uncharacterized protein n=1 Tax=Janibacter indicus TaxID=857417 RepID=A0A7L9IZM8_9MICO|nr:hypothetical protein [Janibacter indicus]QOK22337.1 hypothetical protein IGS73_14795 [Janibacter indicus]
MNLNTRIVSPRLVSNGLGAWTRSLAEAIALDGDRMSQRAADSGLPMMEDEPDWESFTLEDWRLVFDDPNAVWEGVETP